MFSAKNYSRNSDRMHTSLVSSCNELIEHALQTDKYARQLLSSLTCVEATTEGAVFEFNVKECHLNSYSTLHGGCISTLVDWTTTLAIFCETGDLSRLGVSVNLSTTCIGFG